jgi:cell fate (sporulation/competence/biofilm development) regulator YmcA (YheA/YmcA/DUF963 family)
VQASLGQRFALVEARMDAVAVKLIFKKETSAFSVKYTSVVQKHIRHLQLIHSYTTTLSSTSVAIHIIYMRLLRKVCKPEDTNTVE